MAAMGTKIGIWMNHSMAHLIELSDEAFEVRTIESNFTQEEKVKSLLKGELHLQHKEKEAQSRYYKKLMDVVKRYNEVILFGPTNAKEELFNVIAADNRFWKIDIKVRQTDKMSPQQQHAFVREFFSNK